jgi:hypothetical protein
LSFEFAEEVAVDGDGSMVVTGFFFGTVDFGGGSLISGTSKWDSTDIFAAKFGQLSSETTQLP